METSISRHTRAANSVVSDGRTIQELEYALKYNFIVRPQGLNFRIGQKSYCH